MTYDIPAILLGIGMAAYSLTLFVWHKDKSRFDFRDTLIEDNRLSLSRLGQLTALVVSTSILIHQTVSGKLTEWLFIGYMTAWAGAYIAAKLAAKKADDA